MSRIDDLIQALCPEGVGMASIPEVSTVVRGLTYSKADEDDLGEIKVLRSNNIDQSANRLNLAGVKTLRTNFHVSSKYFLSAGDILMSAASGSRAHVGKIAYIFEDSDLCFGGFMTVIRSQERVNSRFLFHVLTSSSFRDYLDAALSTSTINNINSTVLTGFKFPLPPLPIQRAIVEILDKLDALVNDISYGLPAEIAGRRKQYEHYRNKLLTFKELDAA
jgi:type I restriction enzyme S subunit